MASAAAGSVPGAALLTPVKMGDAQLQHRIAMSPLTRTRCEPGTEAMRDINATYYAQRASKGGLLISECAYSSPDGRGYVRAPGIHGEAQLAGWRKVISAVHAKGGVMYVQLFHAGRVSHSDLIGGAQPVSASAVDMSGQLYVEGGVKQDYQVPRPLEAHEIKEVVQGFADSAERAVQCGADGVEIHAGNGYLLQQFMARKTNVRSDAYGGSVANRCRLLLEVIDAVAAKIGAGRTSVKLQPGVTFSDLIEPEEDVKETLDYLGPELSKRKLAYVCLSSLNGEPYFKNLGLTAPNVSFDVWAHFRKHFSGVHMVNGGLGIEAGAGYVASGVADLVSYGVPFIANANLHDLVAAGKGTGDISHGGWNLSIWFSKDPANDAVGYTDWPLQEVKA